MDHSFFAKLEQESLCSAMLSVECATNMQESHFLADI